MIGCKYNPKTNKWEAKLGNRNIGSYPSRIEAAKAYNKEVSKRFSFPILNTMQEDENIEVSGPESGSEIETSDT